MCTYICKYAYTHIYIYLYMHVCMQVYMHVYCQNDRRSFFDTMCICRSIYANIFASVCIYYTYARICVGKCARILKNGRRSFVDSECICRSVCAEVCILADCGRPKARPRAAPGSSAGGPRPICDQPAVLWHAHLDYYGPCPIILISDMISNILVCLSF